MTNWLCRFRDSVESLSADEIALLLIVGFVLGVFPIMGCPTILCLAAALGFRMNLAVLQVVNNAASPIQFALLVPFERAGARLCGGWDPVGLSVAGKIGVAAIHALAGWALLCVPVGLIAYSALLIAMRTRRRLWCNTSESTA